MKQRLLLTLLALFASVGMVKAANTVLVGKATDTKYKLTVNSNIVTVDNQPSTINTVQAEIYNGTTRVAYGKNAKIETTLREGMEVYLRAIVDGYSKVAFIDMDPASATPTLATRLVAGTTNTFETVAPVTLDKDYTFSIALSGKLNQVYEIQSFDRKEVTYNGEPQAYDPTSNNLKIYKKGAPFTYTTLLLTSPLYYKDETGKVVTGGAPVEAGKYDVCIDIPISVDPTDPYAAQTLTAKEALQIKKNTPTVQWPTGVSRIGTGLPLSAAQFFTDGTADVAGTFAWKDGTIIPKKGGFYTVQFTPADTKNYEVIYLLDEFQRTNPLYEGLAITISSKPVIAIDANVSNGHFIVKRGNTEYYSGDEVNDGTTLTITPVADDGFVCKSLVIDEAGTKHTLSGETTFTINGKSIYITGEFEVEPPIVPDPPKTQYTVTLPEAGAVKGVIVDKTGVNTVTEGDSFSFTLETLAEDAKNVVVKVDGRELKPLYVPYNVYRVTPVDGNKVITITLSNPTKIKVAVEQETKNAGGYLLGKVDVKGLADDGTCYYGDQVTIIAFPESGVTFSGWSGSITGKEKQATFIVKEAMQIAPKFSGVPTGIEEIEGIDIYGADGYIFISCNGTAKVTIVSMDGRIRTIEVSGETRIQESAGLYGVVLVQGSQVIKKKVIVR